MILAESLNTRLANAGTNTLICICVVFAVLIFISLVISLFGIIPKIEASRERKKAEKQEFIETENDPIDKVVEQIEAREQSEGESMIMDESGDEEDDMELIAVISAAVAAYDNSIGMEGFVVRSIRKVRR